MSSTFSAFPGSPSPFFVYTVPLGWLDNVREQPLQPEPFPSIPLPPFPSIAAATTAVPLITLPRMYCRFCFLFCRCRRRRRRRRREGERREKKWKKEGAVDGEMN